MAGSPRLVLMIAFLLGCGTGCSGSDGADGERGSADIGGVGGVGGTAGTGAEGGGDSGGGVTPGVGGRASGGASGGVGGGATGGLGGDGGGGGTGGAGVGGGAGTGGLADSGGTGGRSGEGGTGGGGGEGGVAGSAAQGGTGGGVSDGGTAWGGAGGVAGSVGEGGTGGGTGEGGSGPVELVHYFGRFDWREPDSPGCAWTNCGVGVRFDAEALDVQLSGAGGITFQVVVDGELTTEITTSGSEWSSDATVRSYRVAEGLAAGEHDLQLYRNPEAMFGVVAFHGFVPTGGELIESEPPFPRRIEIIGDSISAGYGNDGCPFSAATEVGSGAYGPLAARQLGAVAHVEAWSGKGMARNLDGTTTDLVPDLYGYALPDDDQTDWDYGAYVPDAIVINLGTNDFNGGVTSGDYVAAYEAFVERLRGYYPAAHILCAINGSGSAFSDEVDQVITELGDANVAKIDLGAPNWDGCDGHPNLAAHQAMATTLAARLSSDLGW